MESCPDCGAVMDEWRGAKRCTSCGRGKPVRARRPEAERWELRQRRAMSVMTPVEATAEDVAELAEGHRRADQFVRGTLGGYALMAFGLVGLSAGVGLMSEAGRDGAKWAWGTALALVALAVAWNGMRRWGASPVHLVGRLAGPERPAPKGPMPERPATMTLAEGLALAAIGVYAGSSWLARLAPAQADMADAVARQGQVHEVVSWLAWAAIPLGLACLVMAMHRGSQSASGIALLASVLGAWDGGIAFITTREALAAASFAACSGFLAAMGSPSARQWFADVRRWQRGELPARNAAAP